MSSTPKKSTEAEDVLEFLNSLPQKSASNSNFKAKSNKNQSSKDDEDILDFLDELEKSDIKTKKGKPVKDETKPSEATSQADGSNKPTVEASKESVEDSTKVDETTTEQAKQEGELQDDFVDPITSISNWWSSSGSQTVNSFWNNAVTIKNKANEEVSKIAHSLNDQALSDKLKNLPLEDAKYLIEKAKSVGSGEDHKNPLQFLTSNLTNVLNSLNEDYYDENITLYVNHDLINFPQIESIVHKNFKKVLKQVQGDIRLTVLNQNTASTDTSSESSNLKKFNLFEGKIVDGEKLAFANLDTSIQSIITKEKDSKEASEDTTKPKIDEPSVSQIFLSILPIKTIKTATSTDSSIETIDSNSPDTLSFTVILKDLTHDITSISRSQSFPIKWVTWIDGTTAEPEKEDKDGDGSKKEEDEANQDSDEDIDPSEWVKTWIDDGLSLTIGVLAQDYVIKRMGY